MSANGHGADGGASTVDQYESISDKKVKPDLDYEFSAQKPYNNKVLTAVKQESSPTRRFRSGGSPL